MKEVAKYEVECVGLCLQASVREEKLIWKVQAYIQFPTLSYKLLDALESDSFDICQRYVHLSLFFHVLLGA